MFDFFFITVSSVIMTGPLKRGTGMQAIEAAMMVFGAVKEI